jgi:hypothetical protein
MNLPFVIPGGREATDRESSAAPPRVCSWSDLWSAGNDKPCAVLGGGAGRSCDLFAGADEYWDADSLRRSHSLIDAS